MVTETNIVVYSDGSRTVGQIEYYSTTLEKMRGVPFLSFAELPVAAETALKDGMAQASYDALIVLSGRNV